MKDPKYSLRFPLIFHALLNRGWWRFLIVFLSLLSALAGIASPYFQKLFVDQLTGVDSWGLDLFGSSSHGLYFLIAAFFLLIIQQAFSLLSIYIGAQEGVQLQRELSEALYKHVLHLRTESLNQRPIGEVVSVYATDTQAAGMLLDNALPMGASILFPIILAPIGIYWLFDIPLIYSLAVIFTLAVVNFTMAYRQSKFFYTFKELAAQRTGLVNEWVQNIRTLRILGWIPRFEEKIFEKREEETINRVKMVTNGQLMNSIASSATFVLNIIAIAALIRIRGTTVTPGELLGLMWILGVFLTRPFRGMPWFFVFIFDAKTSLRRVESFLSLRNQPRRIDPELKAALPEKNSSLEVKGLNLNISDKALLNDISFEVKAGEFFAIVGEVGAGKSLVLLSLLGETSATFDTYSVDNQDLRYMHQEEVKKFYSYVPQEGFVMTASLRDNVGFEYSTPPEQDYFVTQALQTAQFDIENENVPGGLGAEIGERGVNLSGGQRQRVSLARAQMHPAPIILMDDCLSAVDVDTEEGLIRDLFTGFWSNRTRILVTHRLSVLKRVDRILFLEAGSVASIGTYTQLVKNSPSFRKFVESLTKEEKQQSDEELYA